jgi:hypothetical protein
MLRQVVVLVNNLIEKNEQHAIGQKNPTPDPVALEILH